MREFLEDHWAVSAIASSLIRFNFSDSIWTLFMYRSVFGIFSITLLMASPLSAWNDAGHMTIARIAWDNLAIDERARIIDILEMHPHLEKLLLIDRPAGATKEEWMFLRASVWADYVRPPKGYPRDDVPKHSLYQYHRGPWHYVNFPYRPGQPTSKMPEVSLPAETNILEQLDQTMTILLRLNQQDAGRVRQITDDQNWAVRLTWLFHLLGDLHQPMHSVALEDSVLFPQPPHSDQGGNKLAVRTDESSLPKNLHWAWDEMFATDSRFDQVCQFAERLTHDPSLKADRLFEIAEHTKFKQWAAESYEVAVKYAYQNDQLKLVLWDSVNSGQSQSKDVPVVPALLLRESQKVAERRIAIAGYRLAVKLREIVRAQAE